MGEEGDRRGGEGTGDCFNLILLNHLLQVGSDLLSFLSGLLQLLSRHFQLRLHILQPCTDRRQITSLPHTTYLLVDYSCDPLPI